MKYNEIMSYIDDHGIGTTFKIKQGKEEITGSGYLLEYYANQCPDVITDVEVLNGNA